MKIEEKKNFGGLDNTSVAGGRCHPNLISQKKKKKNKKRAQWKHAFILHVISVCMLWVQMLYNYYIM